MKHRKIFAQRTVHAHKRDFWTERKIYGDDFFKVFALDSTPFTVKILYCVEQSVEDGERVIARG